MPEPKATTGDADAALRRAERLYKQADAKDHAQAIRDALAVSVAAGVAPALRAFGYLAWQADERALAVASWQRAAAGGDAAARFLLAGSGDPAAEIDANIDFDREFPLFPVPAATEARVVSDDPPIRVFAGVLDTFDCRYAMSLALPTLERAQVIDPGGDRSGQVSAVRTNASTYIPFERVDIIGRCIEMKIAAATGESLVKSEPMSILYYRRGEYYRPHVDYFNPRLDVAAEFLADGGQRSASAVTCLVAPRTGGGTSFPRLDITVPPVAGSTLWFRNCHYNGEVDERSLHSGDDVLQGEKWVLTKWFRESATRYGRAEN